MTPFSVRQNHSRYSESAYTLQSSVNSQLRINVNNRSLFPMLDVLLTRCVSTIGKYGLPSNPPTICSQKFDNGNNVLYFRQVAV